MIPKSVREAVTLRPGQGDAIMHYRGRIELVPMAPVSEMRGMLRGLDPGVDAEPDRERWRPWLAKT